LLAIILPLEVRWKCTGSVLFLLLLAAWRQIDLHAQWSALFAAGKLRLVVRFGVLVAASSREQQRSGWAERRVSARRPEWPSANKPIDCFS